MKHVIKGKI